MSYECSGCRGKVTAHLETEPERRRRGAVSLACEPCGWQGEPYRTLNDAYGGATMGGFIRAAFNRANVLCMVVGVMRRLRTLGYSEQARGAQSALAALHFSRRQINEEADRQDQTARGRR